MCGSSSRRRRERSTSAPAATATSRPGRSTSWQCRGTHPTSAATGTEPAGTAAPSADPCPEVETVPGTASTSRRGRASGLRAKLKQCLALLQLPCGCGLVMLTGRSSPREASPATRALTRSSVSASEPGAAISSTADSPTEDRYPAGSARSPAPTGSVVKCSATRAMGSSIDRRPSASSMVARPVSWGAGG